MARCKISFYCDESKVDEMSLVVLKMAGNVASVVKPEVVKPLLGLAPLKIEVKDPEGYVVGWERIKPKQTRTPGGSKMSQREPGKIVLRLLDDTLTIRPPDICLALKKAGYAVSSWGQIVAALIDEGMLYRSGRGAYRRPTPLEEAQSG